DLNLVKLPPSLLLKNLDNWACCRSFRICILVDNFVTKVDSLIACLDVFHLSFPMPGLLHDNNMGTRKNIEDLSGRPNLTGKYRHCIVNSIWLLKTLDNSVIADEEIIENWKLIRGIPFSPHHLHSIASSLII
uniref:Uncharacterized protein n=1 Tax=Oncorhynchus kisutch TaxID=8019 RepID=A0A8C7FED5_ONCKI